MDNKTNPAKKLAKDIHALEDEIGIRATLVKIPRVTARDLAGMNRDDWLKSSGFPPDDKFIDKTLDDTTKHDCSILTGLKLGDIVIEVGKNVEDDVSRITILETDSHLTEDAILWCIENGVEFPAPSTAITPQQLMDFTNHLLKVVNSLIERRKIAYQGAAGVKIPKQGGITVLHSKDFSIIP